MPRRMGQRAPPQVASSYPPRAVFGYHNDAEVGRPTMEAIQTTTVYPLR